MTETPPPRGPIRRVGVVAKVGHRDGLRMASELGAWLSEREVGVRYERRIADELGIDEGFSRRDLPDDLDLIVVVGGDGTFLSVARAAVPLGIPILGVNFGSLGFLTELQPDELFPGLEKVLAGDYALEERWPLRVRHLRSGEVQQEYALLNDAVITKSALARIITIDLAIDGSPVATYTSDGLILSTPTGSTAYNLSAGGPILDPRMSAFVVSPICPHTMTYRPLVVPGGVQLELSLSCSGEAVYLTLDGQVGFPFDTDDVLRVDQYPIPARLVRVTQRTFFEVLSRKLRWGQR